MNTIITKLLNISIKNSKIVIFIVALITVFFGYFASRVKINPDVEGLLSDQDKIVKLIKKYGNSSTDNDHLVILLVSKNPFTLGKLQLLDKVIGELEALNGSSRSINPFDMITFQRKGRRLEVLTMSPRGHAPVNGKQLQLFRQRLMSDPFAKNFVVSEDGTALSVIIPIKAAARQGNYIRQVRSIVSQLKGEFDTYFTGGVLVSDAVKTYLIRDLTILLLFAVLVIIVIYYLSFRAFRSAFLTLLVVGLGTVWSVGFMALMGFTISIVSITTPSLVLTLGSSYSIHILNQYYRDSREKKAEKKGAAENFWIAESVFHVGKTVLIAGMTTVAGFLSLLVTTLQPTREFGISTSFGIISCALLSFFFLPAMLTHLKPPTAEQQEKVLEGLISNVMGRISVFVVKRRCFIIVFFFILIAGFGLVQNKLKYETRVLNYFPKKEKTVQDVQFIYRKMKGYDQFTITLTAPNGEKDFFLRKSVLEKVSAFEDRIMEHPDITKIFSFTSYLKHLNQVMTGKYEIPENRALILLFSRYIKVLASDADMKNMIGSMANEDFSRIDISVWGYDHITQSLGNDTSLSRLMNDVGKDISAELDPSWQPAVWGVSLKVVAISDRIKKDQHRTTLLSMLFVFIIASFAFRSGIYGLFSLIPLIAGILLNFICMVFLKIPMDMTTVMFSIVVIGVGVDNSIHFLLRFREQAGIYGEDFNTVLYHSLRIAGRPIIVTTMSIIGGLLIFTTSSFRPIAYFGVLVASALSTAAVSTLLILPAMLSCFWRFMKKRG